MEKCNPMITLHIIDREGIAHEFEAPTDMGFNLMEFCRAAELPVKGECGGMAMCATCQVYVLSNHALNKPTDDEFAMLDQAFFVKDNSRLGCQLHLSPQLDGLTVQLAQETTG